MPSVGFEPTISAGERPKTYALDRAATGTGIWDLSKKRKLDNEHSSDHVPKSVETGYEG